MLMLAAWAAGRHAEALQILAQMLRSVQSARKAIQAQSGKLPLLHLARGACLQFLVLPEVCPVFCLSTAVLLPAVQCCGTGTML